MSTENYLKAELDTLIQADLQTWAFLQKGSLDGLWYWDLEHPENEWMSPEFWELFGIDPDTKTHTAREWQDIIFKEDLGTSLENFEAHCANPSHAYDQIVRYWHTDGSIIWVRCRGIAIRDKAGVPVRMLGVHSDVTAIKRSEEQARANWATAEVANEELKSFAYSISHDMKAPANTLQLLLDELHLMTEGQLDEDAAELFSLSRQTVARMQRLADDVLDYTRVIGTEPVFERVSLLDVVDNTLLNMRGDISSSGAQITVNHMPEVSAIPMQMNLLFQNLLCNAIKFCDANVTPIVTIAYEEDAWNEQHNISVTDNGIGISQNHQERIFQLFQRLHSRDAFDGAGIGLPMCQRIAINHRGRIGVKSQPGKGSTFTINLPWSPQ